MGSCLWSAINIRRMLVKAGEEPDPGCVQTEEGGLKYEVVLEEAKTKRMPRPKSAPSSSPRNYQDIQQKLQAAEERRKQFEKEQQDMLSAREKRAEEVRAKKVTLVETEPESGD